MDECVDEEAISLRAVVAILEDDGERLDWLECLIWDALHARSSLTPDHVVAWLLRACGKHSNLRSTIDSMRDGDA